MTQATVTQAASESAPSLLTRVLRGVSTVVVVPFKAAWRVTAATGRALAAAGGSMFTAGGGAVASAVGSVFRREALTAIAAVVAVPFKAAWRVTALTGRALAAAGGSMFTATGGAVAGAVGSVFRRETFTATAAVVAAVAAVAAWWGTVDTEQRRVSGQLLSEFNSDDMWRARLTLQRYYYLLSGDKTAPADLARQTEDYFKAFVYQKATPPSTGRAASDRNKFGSDRDKQEEFLRQVDQSRQKIKNFYEDVIVFSESGLLTSAFREKVLKARFYRNAGDFLECFWLPVEFGQTAALYQGRKDDTDKRACQVVDWYREKYPVTGRQTASCVPYAARQPAFCADPKPEAVALQ